MAIIRHRSIPTGFTLIEVMLVIVVVGIMVSLVQFSGSGSRPEDSLEHASARFAGVFNLAADYAMLNNVELGVLLTDNSYQFLGFDGVQWSALPDQELLTTYDLPDGITMVLQLEDLPIEEPLLFTSETLLGEPEDRYSEPAEKKLIPQIYILSGGDISPFRVTFQLTDSLTSAQAVVYRVTGIYSTPLTIEGPIVAN